MTRVLTRIAACCLAVALGMFLAPGIANAQDANAQDSSEDGGDEGADSGDEGDDASDAGNDDDSVSVGLEDLVAQGDEDVDVSAQSAEANSGDEAETDTAAEDEPHDPGFQVGRGESFIAPDIQPSENTGRTDSESSGSTGGTGGGDSGAGLAVTGTDVEPILAVSAGLLALGGSALVASRRRFGSHV